jgi:sulfotransferase
MHKTFHFLSGLPRSGSTVLAALLSQNPNIYVSASSPLVGLMHGAKHMWDTAEHAKAYPVAGQIERVLGGMMNSFYAHIEKPIVIDKNRAWANPDNQKMLSLALGRQPKIICTVRPIAPILSSFITLIRKNPANVSFIDKELQNVGQPLTDENRCKLLMSEGGHVYQSWFVLKNAYEQTPQNILLVEYDDLINMPAEVLSRIYAFLGLPQYPHDIGNIVNPVAENDEKAYNLPGMHAVRPALKKTAQNPREILGETLFNFYQGGEFWKK